MCHVQLRERSIRKGAAQCLTPVTGCDVELAVHASGQVTKRGLKRCGCLLGCPECAETGLRRRADEINTIVRHLMAHGYVVAFVTATVAHSRKVSLDWSMRALLTGWRRAWSGRALAGAGYVGQIKAWDFTYSQRNGWHPHFHTLMVFSAHEVRSDCDDEEWEARKLRRRLDLRDSASQFCHSRFEQFRAGVVDEGLTTRRNAKNRITGAIENVGWDVKLLNDDEGYETLVEYMASVTKIAGVFGQTWSIGREVADGPGKRSSCSQWTILRAAVTGETHPALAGLTQAQLWELWGDFERATRRKSAVKIGRNLAAIARVEVASEAEAAVGEDGTEVVYSETFTASEWMRLRAAGRIARTIEALLDRALAAGLLQARAGP